MEIDFVGKILVNVEKSRPEGPSQISECAADPFCGLSCQQYKEVLELKNLYLDTILKERKVQQQNHKEKFKLDPFTIYHLSYVRSHLRGINIANLRKKHGLSTHKGTVLGSNLIRSLEALFWKGEYDGKSANKAELDKGNRKADDSRVAEPKRGEVLPSARDGRRRKIQCQRDSTMRGPMEDFLAYRQRAKASKED